jgi:zinc/manganese transport system permease protein
MYYRAKTAWFLQDIVYLPLFALAVTVAVEIAGVYVLFATLISTPLLLCQTAGEQITSAVFGSIATHFISLVLAAGLD